MNKVGYLWVAAAFLSLLVSCKRQFDSQVVESYADGRPKVVREFVLSNQEDTLLTKEIFYFPGEKKYMEKQYDAQGKPEGVWVSWYENGNKNSQGTYENGKWQGLYRVWYPNGKLHYTGEYDKGVRVGVWKFYDSTGTLVRKEDLTLVERPM